MSLSLDEFTQRLIESGAMSSADIGAFVAKLPDDKKPKDGEQLAKQLVKAKRISAYQAQVVYSGKGESLTLGNYFILDKLGQGGMGMVLKAEHRRMKRLVAIKVMSPTALKTPDSLKRFHREVEAAAKLRHPNIVAADDADEAKGTHFLAMEYVDGSDLSTHVKKHGPMPVVMALQCILQAARGLEYAHSQGVIHRDIKPANLLVSSSAPKRSDGSFSREGATINVKILDMGLARIDHSVGRPSEGAGLTETGAIMGTVDYMSPEQAMDTKTADARSDIYSLGCALHYLVTGKTVYSGDTIMKRLLAHRDKPIPEIISLHLPREHPAGENSKTEPCDVLGANPEKPVTQSVPATLAPLNAVFRHMVAKRPEDRPQSMTEVIAELEQCLAVMAPPSGGSVSPKSVMDSTARSASAGVEKVAGSQSLNSSPPATLSNIAAAAPELLRRSPEGGNPAFEPMVAETAVYEPHLKPNGSDESQKLLVPSASATSDTLQPDRASLMYPTQANMNPVQDFATLQIPFESVPPTELFSSSSDASNPSTSLDRSSAKGMSQILVLAAVALVGVVVLTIMSQGNLKTDSFASPVVPENTASTKSTALGTNPQDTTAEVTHPVKPGSHGWPAKAPEPAIAPFDENQARVHQEAWAKHLGMTVETTNSVGAKMVLIPPGEFLMGAPDTDAHASPQEKPQHQVRLTKPFAMGATEVTNQQFRQFVEATKYVTQAESDGQGAFEVNAHARKPSYTWSSPDLNLKGGDEFPVRCVSWEDARRFCEWLTQVEGRVYRLPTEAEWEFACRAGTTSRYNFGNDISDTQTPPGSNGAPLRRVGQLPANPFGLFDMHGSVNEICRDAGRTFTAEPVTDPVGSLEMKVPAVVRGGAVSSSAARLRSSNRYLNDARQFPELNFATFIKGFRVVAEFASPSSPANTQNDQSLTPFAVLTSDDYEWTEPVNLGPRVNSDRYDYGPELTADGRTLYFHSRRGADQTTKLWKATRPSPTAAFDEPALLPDTINESEAIDPTLTADELILVFCSNRKGGQGGRDLWMSQRVRREDAWGPPVNLAELNFPFEEWEPAISADGLTLIYHSNRPGGQGGTDLYMSRRTARNLPFFGAAQNLGPNVNSPHHEGGATLSADGRVLFFHRNRLNDQFSLFMSVRESADKSFGPATKVNLAHSKFDLSPSLSADGKTLLFASSRDGGVGGVDLWQTHRVRKPAATAR